jgi:hypothetical protein
MAGILAAVSQSIDRGETARPSMVDFMSFYPSNRTRIVRDWKKVEKSWLLVGGQ